MSQPLGTTIQLSSLSPDHLAPPQGITNGPKIISAPTFPGGDDNYNLGFVIPEVMVGAWEIDIIIRVPSLTMGWPETEYNYPWLGTRLS